MTAFEMMKEMLNQPVPFIDLIIIISVLVSIIKMQQDSKDRREKYYKEYIQKLENRNDELMKYRMNKTPEISSDILHAIKYAMKHAHPDNGGNSDDFIRFQKCYDELTKNGY